MSRRWLCCVCLTGACALSCSGRLEAADTPAPAGGSNGSGVVPPSAGSGNPIGVAGSSTSPNGNGGNGGSGNGPEDPGDLPIGGADVELSADAQLMPLQDRGVTGSVHFAQLGKKVDMSVTLSNCPAGPHALHIHANAACGDDGNAAGGHWQPQHDGIGDINCGDDGSAQYSFTPPDGTWSIGGPVSTNLLGHALILHAGANQPDPGGRLACGIPAKVEYLYRGSCANLANLADRAEGAPAPPVVLVAVPTPDDRDLSFQDGHVSSGWGLRPRPG